MPLKFDGRHHFDPATDAIYVAAEDGDRFVPCYVRRAAIADAARLRLAKPHRVLQIYRANAERIQAIASSMFDSGLTTPRGSVVITSADLGAL